MAEPCPDTDTLRILVVDDDDVDRSGCVSMLGNCGTINFVVSQAHTGTGALKQAASNPFDCVLVDQNLPDFSGTDLIDELRLIAGDAHLPVIILAAQGDEMLAVRAMKHNASDYLPKDRVSPDALARCVATAVRESRLRHTVDAERETLRAVNEELVGKTREVQSFYQSVSHELKTPLTAIREYLSLMQDNIGGCPSPEHQAFIGTALDCCDKLTRLVNDLFDTARIETGKLELCQQPTDLRVLIGRCMDMLDSSRDAAGLVWHLNAPPVLPLAEVDPDRISQVVANLLTNAIKFTPPGGTVSVTVSRVHPEPHLRVAVRDTGRGIADTDLLRIFDRLYQSDSETFVHHDGMGIGLYLSSTIVKLHGGEIQASSRLGQGSTFCFTLPIADADP